LRELSLHILDLVENSIAAGAGRIEIRVVESRCQDLVRIEVGDNGRGMPAEKIERLSDPFVTRRKTRRVGFGLSLLEAAARRCEGKLIVESRPGQGTRVKAVFRRSHIDRAPVGDMAATFTTLVSLHPEADFLYTHEIDGRSLTVDTREVRKEIEDLPICDPVVVDHLNDFIRTSLKEMA
jgi:nitrogen fixation/metabolism regulation signal transduction histidine kinase